MDKKTKIYKAAERIFAKFGFEKTAVDEIAEKAAIAKGTIYYHFKSKDEIFFGLMEQGIDNFITSVGKKIEDIENPKDKLEKLIFAQLEYYEEHRDFCRVLVSEFGRLESHWKKNIADVQNRYVKTIDGIIKEGQEKNIFKEELDSKATTTALFSLVALAGLAWAVFHEDISRETMRQTIVSIFMSGIVKA